MLAKVTVAGIGDFGECLLASTRSAEHASGMLSFCHSQFLQPIFTRLRIFLSKNAIEVVIGNPHSNKDQCYFHTKLKELLIDFHYDNLSHKIRGPKR